MRLPRFEHDFLWVPMDVHLTDNAKIRRAGFWGHVVYLHALRVAGRGYRDGVIPERYLETRFMAAELGINERDADCLPRLAAGCGACVDSGLLAPEDPSAFRIVGWTGAEAFVFSPTRAEKKRNEKKRKGNEIETKPQRAGAWSRELKEALPVTERVLEKLNAKAGTRFRPGRTHVARIARLLAEGYSEEQIRAVVWWQCKQWLPREDMRPYLRPSTLFGPEKFADYVGVAEAELAKARRSA